MVCRWAWERNKDIIEEFQRQKNTDKARDVGEYGGRNLGVLLIVAED